MTQKTKLLSTTALESLMAARKAVRSGELIITYPDANSLNGNQDSKIDELISVYEELGLVVLDLRHVD